MLTFDDRRGCFMVDGAPIILSESDTAEMNSMEWWHSIPFGGVRPKAVCDPVMFIPLYLMDRIDFRGKSVLDIGCWDGFQCFYAEAKGASRVVGLDDPSQRHMTIRPREFAKRKLQSKVEFVDLNVYDLTPERLGTFDIVSMFGVLYHLKHPMLGMERACGVCKGEFLLSTHFVALDTDIPVCLLYPGAELCNDHTNWSGPNIPWVESALKMQGFQPKHRHEYHRDRVCVYATKMS